MYKQENITLLKEELAGYAEQIASEFGIKLDYSVKSVKKVEKILSTLHKEYRRTNDDKGLNGVALEFAAYIIKVIEKNFEPGEWNRNHPTFGPDTFPYKWYDVELFPYSWGLKRIFDGSGDDVWVKFKALIVKRAQE